MTVLNIVFFALTIIPLLIGIIVITLSESKVNFENLGLVLTTALILLMAFVTNELNTVEQIYLRFNVLPVYGIYWQFSLDPYKLYLLLTVQAAYFFTFLLSRGLFSIAKHLAFFIFIFQGTLNAFIMNENILMSCFLQLLLIILTYFIVLFGRRGDDELIAALARKFMIIQGWSAAILVVVIMVLLNRSLLASLEGGRLQLKEYSQFLHDRGDHWLFVLFLSSFLLAMPVLTWARWFSMVIRNVSCSGVIFVSCYLAGVLFFYLKMCKDIFYRFLSDFSLLSCLLGFLSIFIIAANIFHSKHIEEILSSIPALFISLILFALGFSLQESYGTIYLLCLIIPCVVILLLFLGGSQKGLPRSRAVMCLAAILLFALPGTPTFSIFYRIGRIAFSQPHVISVLMAALWLMYFSVMAFTFFKISVSQEELTVNIYDKEQTAVYTNKVNLFCFFASIFCAFFMAAFVE